MAKWRVSALGIFVGYRPPKRHTRFDHLSIWQKIGKLDLIGCGLLTIGLSLFLTGLNLGGNLYPWTNALFTLVVDIAVVILFGGWESKGTKIGIMNHQLFQSGKTAGRTFALCVALKLIEGTMLFAYVIFHAVTYCKSYRRHRP